LQITRLLKFIGLPKECQVLLIRAFFFVLAIRLLLWFLPLASLQKVLKVFRPRSHPDTLKGILPERIAWAVTVASWDVFRATCLVQALATQVLLAGEGMPSILHIGVMKGEHSSIEAHAWVESEGRIVIGGSELIPYKKLASLRYEIE
jgi:hypothetical protein